MQKKHFITWGVLSGLLIVSLLAFNTPQQKSDATCCKKEVKQCPSEITPVETSMENLSLQFIALPASFY